MKKITKKLMAVLLAIVCMASLAACGSKVEVSPVDEATQSYLVGQMESLLSTLGGMSAEELKMYEEVDDTFTVAAVTNFEGVMEELGAYKGIESTEIEVDEKEYTVTSLVQYEQRAAIVTLTLEFKSQSFTPMSITFDAQYSMGETLQRAGLNTLMGVGIVFCVLLFLCFLISLFKYIPALEAKFKNKGKAESAQEAAPAPAAVAAPVVEEASNDDELAAVISAAIAAYEAEAGGSTDGFVVRSIKRRPSNKWHA